MFGNICQAVSTRPRQLNNIDALILWETIESLAMDGQSDSKEFKFLFGNILA
jgi:hypothetical protein